MRSSRLAVSTLLLLGAMGCGGQRGAPSAPTYRISGTVSGGAVSGVTVSLTGSQSATTTTDASGDFSFGGLANGTYGVTLAWPGYVFAPVLSSVTISGADVSGLAFAGIAIAAPAPNVMAVTVNGALCLPTAYDNEPCVSVTVCSPSTAQCQAIDGILLDTGSVGLRIFQGALTVALTPVASGSGTLAECVQFGSSADWGPIEMASVVLGGETAVSLPIQVIDSSFAAAPALCAHADVAPAAAGFNGILGIGLSAQDCGTACASAESSWYYSCGAGGCSQVPAAAPDQVPNPVVSLTQDNNGFILELPGVPTGGATSVSGALVLGIGTQSNNGVPSGVKAYPVDGNGEFRTLLGGATYPARLDTGSNALFFPTSPESPPVCSSFSSWYCPSSPVDITATNLGPEGSPNNPITFPVADFESVVGGSKSVFGDIAGPSEAAEGFIWGLPFFLGRCVYFGPSGTASSLSTGPYVAY